MLRNNPEEYWDPGIYIGTTIAENSRILLVIKVKPAQTISDIRTKSKVTQRMDVNMDGQMQNLLTASRGIRDGWIETVQLLRNTIESKANREEEVRAEAVAADSIRAAAVIAIRQHSGPQRQDRWSQSCCNCLHSRGSRSRRRSSLR